MSEQVDLSQYRRAELVKSGEGVADFVTWLVREAVSHLDALRFAALAHRQGDEKRLDAVLDPYMPEGATSAGIGRSVLDEPVTALSQAIVDGTPADARARLILDSLMDTYGEHYLAVEALKVARAQITGA